jgi:hypothetical protein
MIKVLVLATAALALAGCQSDRQTAGTATGVAAGALVAGPVGAVVGGVAGAAATAPGGPVGSRRECEVVDRRGRVVGSQPC